VVSVVDGAQFKTPESASEHEKVAVTLVLFQPAAFVAGLSVGAIVGDVLSRLTVADTVAAFPAMSVATPATGWPAPSVETTDGAAQEPTPERGSEQTKVAVTSTLFQPAAFADGLRAGVIVGGVLSRLTVALAVATFPAASVAVPGIA
jgi:hypothetical protein